VGLAKFTHQLKPKFIIFRGLFLAYLTHALFNTFLSSENMIVLLALPLVIVIYFIGVASHGRKHLVQKKEKWKAVISRFLLISIKLLWLLVFYDWSTPGTIISAKEAEKNPY